MKATSVLGDVQSYIAHEDGMTITGTVQDMTPYAEQAKKLSNEGQHGSKDMRHAASLPFAAVETYCNVNGITFQEWMNNPVHMKRMVNDPALADFRIWKGQM